MLEEYFEFLAPDDIRLKGSRIGIESVIVNPCWFTLQTTSRQDDTFPA